MFGNWVKEETTTTGTGTLTLTQVSGFPRFSDLFGTQTKVSYVILDSTGAPIEAGIGTYTASNQLARTRVFATFVSGTYDNTAPSAATLASGTKTVIATPIAGSFVSIAQQVESGAAFRGLWSPHMQYTNAINTNGIAANQAVYTPFCLLGGIELASLAVRVTTGSATNARMALYQFNHDGSIGPKIVETADVDVSTTGTKTGSVTATWLNPGWYLTAFGTKGNTPTITAYNAANNIQWVTPWGMDSSVQPYGFAEETLSGGWTDLPTSPSVASKVLVVSDYSPLVYLVPT